jgi:hypothetical protein
VVLQSGSLVTGTVTYYTNVTNQGTIGTPPPIKDTTQRQIAADITWSPCTPALASVLAANISSGTYTYNQSTGDLTVSSSGNIVTLKYNGTLGGVFCFRNISISGGATIKVAGPVVLYVKGTIAASGGAFSNTTNFPADLRILDSYNGSNGVNISGGTQSYLTVYAPLTDVIISGNSPLTGAILGKTIVSSGNAQIHVDLNIAGGSGGWAPGLHTI